MKNVLTVTLTLLFILLCGCAGFLARSLVNDSPPYRKDLPDLILAINAQDKYPPVVRLHDRKTGEFFCSGTVIAKNYVVTAGHCLQGRSRRSLTIDVRTIDNVSVKAYGAAAFYEGRSDQGLILGDFSDFNALPFNDEPMAEITSFVNQERLIIACGFPYGGSFFCTPLMARGQSFFAFAGQGFLYPGMSGGPVMAADSRIVIGVNTAVVDNGIIVSPLVEILAHAGVKRAPAGN